MFSFIVKIIKFYYWWTLQDSNLQPTGYEPVALTIELRVRELNYIELF